MYLPHCTVSIEVILRIAYYEKPSHNNNNNNTISKETKEKTEDLRQHKTLRQTLSEMNTSECKLNRSSSLRKHEDNDRKLKRTGSLNVRPSRSDSKIESRISKFEALVQNFENKNGVLKRSDSLTKSEKTDMNKRRQDVKSKWMREKENVKLKRKSVSNARSIKRRHTVGGTKDFDKVNWLQREKEAAEENKKERRTSSPDLSYSRLQNILSDVMRPHSLLVEQSHFSSRLLESHV
uniref:Uncharacterized protein n=2 Tax=Cacopsylla melanoneura TaxID=428564 RepID=A0A8D8W0J3_9HEMI